MNTQTSKQIDESTNQPINQSTNQPINQSTNQPINISIYQPINLSTYQPINLSTYQPLNLRPANEPINQPVSLTIRQSIESICNPLSASSTCPSLPAHACLRTQCPARVQPTSTQGSWQGSWAKVPRPDPVSTAWTSGESHAHMMQSCYTTSRYLASPRRRNATMGNDTQHP